MRSPRPVDGRARNYGYQGSLSDGRLGGSDGGLQTSKFSVLGFSVGWTIFMSLHK